MSRSSGVLIVIEGADGCGKSLMTDRLERRLALAEVPVHRTYEPTRQPIGRFIREVLLGNQPDPGPEAMAYLFAADRAVHVRGEIMPAIEQGKVVICDRYYLSTIAYQSGKGSEISVGRIVDISSNFFRPHITIVLHAPLAVCGARLRDRARMGDGRLDNFDKDAAMQERVAKVYADSPRLLPNNIICMVDADAPEDIVFRRVSETIGIHLGARFGEERAIVQQVQKALA